MCVTSHQGLRSLIGRWRDDPHAAGLLAREVALAAARAHLASENDVVIPQFLGRMTFIEQLERLARGVDATFHEVVLLDSKENMLRHFAERSRAASDPLHVEAQVMIERSDGFEDVRGRTFGDGGGALGRGRELRLMQPSRTIGRGILSIR